MLKIPPPTLLTYITLVTRSEETEAYKKHPPQRSIILFGSNLLGKKINYFASCANDKNANIFFAYSWKITLTKLEHVLCLQNGFIYLKTQQIGKMKHVKTIIEHYIYIALPFILKFSKIVLL